MILLLNEVIFFFFFFPLWLRSPTRAVAYSFLMRFLDHTQRRTIVGRTPLDEWSARRRDLYLTTHNTHNRQTSMPPVGFEPGRAAYTSVYIIQSMRNSIGIGTAILASCRTNCHYSSASDEVQLGCEGGETDNFMLFDFTYDLLLLMSPLKGKWSFFHIWLFLRIKLDVRHSILPVVV